MRRILLTIATILAYLPAFSQINLKDSTVQIVAYWEKGEKYFYDTKSYKLHIHNGDTSTVSEISQRFSLEVIDSTANSYKLKCKMESRPHMRPLSADEDTVMKMVYNVMEKYLDKMIVPVVFITDEYGTLQDIDGIDALQKEMYSVVSDMVEEFKKEFNSKLLGDAPEQERKKIMNVVEELFNNAVLEQYKDKQSVLKNFQEIVALLTFHGAKLDINKEYTSSSKETLPLYGGAEVDIKETFYVYEYNPQTSWVSLDYYKNYDHEQLMELQFDVVKKITGAKNVKKEDLHKLNINCYTGVQVHTDTGWPGYVYSEKRTEKNGGINLEIFKVDIDLQ